MAEPRLKRWLSTGAKFEIHSWGMRKRGLKRARYVQHIQQICLVKEKLVVLPAWDAAVMLISTTRKPKKRKQLKQTSFTHFGWGEARK